MVTNANRSTAASRPAIPDNTDRNTRRSGSNAGVQLGKYQSKEQVCTKEAADLFPTQPSSETAAARPHAPVSQSVSRQWSSLGRYTTNLQKTPGRNSFETHLNSTRPRPNAHGREGAGREASQREDRLFGEPQTDDEAQVNS